jgi:glycine cleavage system H protein
MGDWKTPDDVRYMESDEWVKIEGDDVTVGLTDYAQDQLSDVVYVELPEVGDTLAKGDSYGVVESVKAASDMYMPLGGEITAVNEALEDTPELVNEDPYGKGWMIRFKASDPSEADGLLDAKAYDAHCDARA